jgi:Arylsulfotransferase (ASST)
VTGTSTGGMRRAGLALVALGATAAVSAPGAAAATRIGARPALYPPFSTKVSDYVSHCHSGRKLRLVIHAARGTRVAVGNHKPRAGKTKVALSLSGGQAVTIRLIKGNRRSTHHVRCLPKDFIKWAAVRRGRPQASFYMVTPSEGAGGPFVVIFDNHGVPVWWKRLGYHPIDAKLLPDGNLAWSEFSGAPFAVATAPYSEFRLDGSFVRRIEAVGVNTDFHDLQVMPNGDYLLLSYVPRDTPTDLSPYGGPKDALVLDGVAQEVTPAGKVVWSWNSRDHVATSESEPRMDTVLKQPATLPDGRIAYDLVHINSIDPTGASFVISLAFTDALFKVNGATGAVEWKFGGTQTSESLHVAGEPDGSLVFGSQHDARVLGDGTLTVHDNRTLSPFGPRALRYRIDEAARTATPIESISDPQVGVSICCGGARRLPGGNWAVSWGFHPIVEELTPSGKVVFRLRFGKDVFSYRVVPVPRGKLSVRALRAGMDAMAGG